MAIARALLRGGGCCAGQGPGGGGGEGPERGGGEAGHGRHPHLLFLHGTSGALVSGGGLSIGRRVYINNVRTACALTALALFPPPLVQLPPARPGCLSAILLPLDVRGAAVRACERTECIHGPSCCGNTIVKLPNGDFAVTIAHHKVPELMMHACPGVGVWLAFFPRARGRRRPSSSGMHIICTVQFARLLA